MKKASLLAELLALSSLSAAAVLPRPEGVAFDKGALFTVAERGRPGAAALPRRDDADPERAGEK